MNTTQKQQILAAIEREIGLPGMSAAKLATKVGLNDAYISHMRNNKWGLPLKDEHWVKVARALNVSFDGWQITETANLRVVYQVLSDAKDQSLFLAVSSPAGSGKTLACKEYVCGNAHQSVYYYQIPHGETNKVDFLRGLAQALGIDISHGGYMSANKLADVVINFFERRLDQRPLLVIDEADKLTDKAKRFFISLYNAVEGSMGCVILGTDNLEKQIKTGVRHSRNGFDEIDSRFGRRFIRLTGLSKKEAIELCAANGVQDSAKAAELWEECGPTTATAPGGRSFKVITDLRPLRRKIERELMIGQQQMPAESAA